jgi:hypothetical protein
MPLCSMDARPKETLINPSLRGAQRRGNLQGVDLSWIEIASLRIEMMVK